MTDVETTAPETTGEPKEKFSTRLRKVLPVAARGGLRMAFAVGIGYTLVMAAMGVIIPAMSILIGNQIGLGKQDLTLDVMVAGWLLPLLFATGIVFVIVVALIKRLWRWARKAG